MPASSPGEPAIACLKRGARGLGVRCASDDGWLCSARRVPAPGCCPQPRRGARRRARRCCCRRWPMAGHQHPCRRAARRGSPERRGWAPPAGSARRARRRALGRAARRWARRSTATGTALRPCRRPTHPSSPSLTARCVLLLCLQCDADCDSTGNGASALPVRSPLIGCKVASWARGWLRPHRCSASCRAVRSGKAQHVSTERRQTECCGPRQAPPPACRSLCACVRMLTITRRSVRCAHALAGPGSSQQR